MRLIVKWLLRLVLLALVIVLVAVWRVQSRYSDKIITESQLASSSTVGIVFGAGLKPDGTPREMLEARVLKGIELLQAGKVGQLLLTGAVDRGHDEPRAMQTFALSHGATSSQLILDEEGDTTFDSCFNVMLEKNPPPGTAAGIGSHDVILVTQKFHLPRALYLCNRLGVNSIGVAAVSSDSKIESAYAKREYAASIKAWLQINLPFTRAYFEK